MKHDYPNKIIFLDIDGVLSTSRNKYQDWDIEAMDNLIKILDATGAKIIVSSSWRTDLDKMVASFREHKCKEEIIDAIKGITCRAYRYVIKGSNLPLVRGNEIKHFTDTVLKYPWHHDKSLNEVYSNYKEDGSFDRMSYNKLNVDYTYLILDDDTDMLYEHKDNFIRTNAEVGITSKDVVLGISILNKI